MEYSGFSIKKIGSDRWRLRAPHGETIQQFLDDFSSLPSAKACADRIAAIPTSLSAPIDKLPSDTFMALWKAIYE